MKTAPFLQRPFVLLSLLSLILATSTHAGQQPQPAPEAAVLKIWLGEWTYEGKGEPSPFGPASGKYKGRMTSRLILGGFFLESRWQDRNEAGYFAQGLHIRGYDPATRTYISRGYENDGSASAASTVVHGNTWTSTGTRTEQGRSYKTRYVVTFARDGRSATSVAEYSDDEGQTWRTWWKDTMKRLRKQPSESNLP